MTGSSLVLYTAEDYADQDVVMSALDGDIAFLETSNPLAITDSWAIRDDIETITTSGASATTYTVADGTKFRVKEVIPVLTGLDVRRGTVIIDSIATNVLTIKNGSGLVPISGDKLQILGDDILKAGAWRLLKREDYVITKGVSGKKVQFEIKGIHEFGFGGPGSGDLSIVTTTATSSLRVEEIDPITTHNVNDQIIDESNHAATTERTIIDHENYKNGSLEWTNSGGVTLTIFGCNNDSADASADTGWTDLTTEITGVASQVDNSDLVFLDSNIRISRLMIKLVYSDTSNAADVWYYKGN